MKLAHVAFPAMADILGRRPVSDGTFCEDIHGFRRDERGILDSTFAIMPLIPDVYRAAVSQPAPLQEGVLGVCCWLRNGSVPEMLILTASLTHGVYRFAPWDRAIGGTAPALEATQTWRNTGAQNVAYTGKQVVPVSMVQGNGGVVFTFGDGGRCWLWDGFRLRALGTPERAAPPTAWGPEVDGTSPNGGGFTVPGRFGTVDSSWWSSTAGDTVGGMSEGERVYAVVYRNNDGGYSATSVPSAPVGVQLQVADTAGGTPVAGITRGFRLQVGAGPEGTVARILLASADRKNLPPGDTGALRYLTTIPHNEGTVEYIDRFSDGELGDYWQHREPEPVGVYFLVDFDGGLWRCRTDGSPSRLWWSERSVTGPVFASIMEGHWIDVGPSSGPITAALAVPWSGTTGQPLLMVFKENACHYVTGSYPAYQAGVLHPAAGCGGHRLVQAAPDGSIIWYGSGTFWRFTSNEGVQDIGAALRRKLKNVNLARVAFGQSWVDRASAEVVFVLPWRGSNGAIRQFIWDYELGGWRTRSDVTVTAACQGFSGEIYVGGTLNTATSGPVTDTTTLWVYGRGYPAYAVPSPTWLLSTGWCSPQAGSADIHRMNNITDFIVTAEERCSTAATSNVYLDWNEDTSAGTDSLNAYAMVGGPPAFYGTAVYGTSLWRTRRIYTQRLRANADPNTTFQFSLTGSSPVSLADISAVARPSLVGPGVFARDAG